MRGHLSGGACYVLTGSNYLERQPLIRLTFRSTELLISCQKVDAAMFPAGLARISIVALSHTCGGQLGSSERSESVCLSRRRFASMT